MLTATIDQLRTVATAADDASGYFPAMYSRVTSRVEQASARMEPSRAASMERFARTFAAWYLEPISGRRPMPGCWQAAADVAADRQPFGLLGVSAAPKHRGLPTDSALAIFAR